MTPSPYCDEVEFYIFWKEQAFWSSLVQIVYNSYIGQPITHIVSCDKISLMPILFTQSRRLSHLTNLITNIYLTQPIWLVVSSDK